MKSSTNRGTSNLPRGQVVANIVRANIPVENGVVHLIGEKAFGETNKTCEKKLSSPTDRPLVIISQTMADYLKNEENRGENTNENAK